MCSALSKPEPLQEVVPLETSLPGRQRTSIIRVPMPSTNAGTGREGAEALRQLQDLESRADKRLRGLESGAVLVQQLQAAVQALSREHQTFHAFKTAATAELAGLAAQREHSKGVLRSLVQVLEKCSAETAVLEGHRKELRTQVEVRHDPTTLCLVHLPVCLSCPVLSVFRHSASD